MDNRPNNVNQIPCKFDSRYVLSDTPTRISRMINNEKSVEKLIMSTQLPYVFTKEPVPMEFNYSLSEAMMKESYSKISWSLTHSNIQSPILISFILTENTLEKTVLLIFEIEIIKRDLIPKTYIQKIINTFPNICVEMIKNIAKELEEDNKDIYHYESRIINYPMECLWDIVCTFHCLMFKCGAIKNCNSEVPVSKLGGEISFFVCCKKKKTECKLKISKYKKENNSNKWEIGYKPIEGPFKHSENIWTLIRLSNNQTMVGNTTKYSEHIEPEILKNISKEKINMFDCIEELLKEKFENKKEN